jgi:hypothetical protein
MKVGMGTMTDRMLPAHWVGHAPLQGERHAALEKEAGGWSKEEVYLAYHLFPPSRR